MGCYHAVSAITPQSKKKRHPLLKLGRTDYVGKWTISWPFPISRWELSRWQQSRLVDVREYRCHPGVTWLMQCVRSTNLPFLFSDITSVSPSRKRGATKSNATLWQISIDLWPVKLTCNPFRWYTKVLMNSTDFHLFFHAVMHRMDDRRKVIWLNEPIGVRLELLF